jgi:hypothetical protein
VSLASSRGGASAWGAALRPGHATPASCLCVAPPHPQPETHTESISRPQHRSMAQRFWTGAPTSPSFPATHTYDHRMCTCPWIWQPLLQASHIVFAAAVNVTAPVPGVLVCAAPPPCPQTSCRRDTCGPPRPPHPLKPRGWGAKGR